MNPKSMWMILLAGALGVAAYAGLRSPTPVPEPVAAPAPATPDNRGALPTGHPPIPGAGPAGAMPEGHPPMGTPGLPQGHPPVGQGAPPVGAAAAPAAGGDETGAVTWTKPARWQDAPNPSSMRMATYRIPKAGSDAEDAEMSVSRAGGGTAANAERWVGQFDEAGQKTAKRSERTVGGFKTTMVEVEGTFAAGSMMGGAAAPKTGFALVGAIVETPGMAHFFKLTGPSATVKSARAEVDALLQSIKAK